MIARLLRGAAVLAAAIGFLDPAWTAERTVPVNVDLRLETSSGEAGGIRDRLVRGAGDAASFDRTRDASAVVVIGDALPADALEQGKPASLVSETPASGPNVSVAAPQPGRGMPGWTMRIGATVRGRGVAGRTSAITLEHERATLARVEHTWTREDEVFDPQLSFTPPESGVLHCRIVARPIDGEATVADNHADVRLLVEARRLKTLIYEPRPSWGTAFVRRVLEADPAFEVAGMVRASRGIEVRSGASVDRLTYDALVPFDLAIAGAPEELTRGEVDALQRFARRRGGAIVLLPDRRPSGPYTTLLPPAAFDEVLLDSSVEIAASPAGLRAAELAVPRSLPPQVEVLGTIPRGGGAKPVVFAWPIGPGRAIFSGALDAWRQRGREERFAHFWRGQAMAAALRSPRSIDVDVEPAILTPGGRGTVRVRLRPDRVADEGAGLSAPPVSARIVSASGAERWVRLWPAASPGVFEGTFDADGPGDYDVQAATDGASGDSVLLVRDGARSTAPSEPGTTAALAAATGGVTTHAGDLSPVVAHLRALPRARVKAETHPARSIWWAAAFAALLCAEWALRRRRGLA